MYVKDNDTAFIEQIKHFWSASIRYYNGEGIVAILNERLLIKMALYTVISLL